MKTMTMRTIACSCSLSARPLSRRRSRTPSPRLEPISAGWAATASDIRDMPHAALGRQIHADGSAGADRAVDVEGAAMQPGQLDRERQAKPGAGLGDEGGFVDASEARLD